MPAQVSFDDLIPQQGRQPRQGGGISFDDLIPENGGDYRGAILPLQRDGATGDVSLAMPRAVTWAGDLVKGIASAGADAVTLPGEVMRGETPLYDGAGNVTPEVLGRALDFAAFATPAPPAHMTTPARAGLANARPRPRPAAPPLPAVSTRTPTPVAEAGRRQGVDIARGVSSGSRAVREATQRVADIPIIGQPLRRGASEALEQMDDAVRRTVDNLGSGSIERAGTRVADDITEYAGKTAPRSIGAREAALYRAVDDVVDDTVLTPLTSTQRAVQRIAGRRSAAALDDAPMPGLQAVQPALQRNGLSYSGIKDLRTFYREAMNSPQQLTSLGMSQNQAQAIYRGLSDDLRTAVSRAGGRQGIRAFERANQFAQVAARERKALDTILGREGTRSAENIGSRLRALATDGARADIRQLYRVRRAVSAETWDELSSSVLANMGRVNQGPFSGARFISDWGKLSQPGRNALFSSPQVRTNIDDLLTISSRLQDVSRMANYSQSGSLLSSVAGVTGLAFSPIKTLAILLPAHMFARVMSKPASSRKVVMWARAYEASIRNPSAASARVLADRAQALAIVIAEESGTPQAVRQIAEGLRNPQTLADQAPADEQQEQQAQPIQR